MSTSAVPTGAATQSRGEGGVRAVTRALALMDAFTEADTVYSIAALARHVELPRTTTLRLVDTLVEEGMLAMSDDGTVRVGPRLIRWGTLASAGWDVPHLTLERMQQVATTTGETVSIYIRRGLRRVVVGQVPSPHTLRHAVQVGEELPLWGGAAALVLLGMEPLGNRSGLIEAVAADSAGRITPDQLTALVDDAREAGFALSHGGRAEGTSGLAIPLHVGHTASRIPAGLALGGPSFRFHADAIAQFLGELRSAGDDIVLSGLPAAMY